MLRYPRTDDEWYEFMQAFGGNWKNRDYFNNSIKNYGYTQLQDFYRSADKDMTRLFDHYVGRTLGQMANAYNPDAITPMSPEIIAKELAEKKAGIYEGLQSMKNNIALYGNFVTKELIDQANGMIASAAKWYGEDVIKATGFLPGGNSEITVDIIGSTTGQSQPQTYKINQETGEVSGGTIAPVREPKTDLAARADDPLSKYRAMDSQQLFMAIRNGEITPNQNDSVWKALYESGGATQAQKDAYTKWQNYMVSDPGYVVPTGNKVVLADTSMRGDIPQPAQGTSVPGGEPLGTTPSAPGTPGATDWGKLDGQQLFMAIWNGQIVPSKDNPAWTALYQNGQATAAQMEAYSKWTEYMKNNPTYVPPTQPGGVNGAPGTLGTTGAPGTTGTPGSTVTPGTPGGLADNIQAAIDRIMNDPNIPDDLKSLYVQVIKGWDSSKEINIDNILSKFNEIKESTIDPVFSEKVRVFTDDLQRQISFQTGERNRSLEAERANQGETIRQAKEGIEQSGLTFSGESVVALGKDSAYARPGTPEGDASAIPLQTPFGGTELFYEGQIPQSNRLMSSSSEARHARNLELLGMEAEKQLGTSGALGLNIPGFGATGISTGNIQAEKESQLADLLTTVAGQGRQVADYSNPVNVFQ